MCSKGNLMIFLWYTVPKYRPLSGFCLDHSWYLEKGNESRAYERSSYPFFSKTQRQSLVLVRQDDQRVLVLMTTGFSGFGESVLPQLPSRFWASFRPKMTPESAVHVIVDCQAVCGSQLRSADKGLTVWSLVFLWGKLLFTFYPFRSVGSFIIKTELIRNLKVEIFFLNVVPHD